MINYKNTIDFSETYDQGLAPIKSSSKINFIRTNNVHSLLAMCNHFLNNTIEVEDDILNNIKTNLAFFLEKNNDKALDLGCFKCKMYQSNDTIGLILINDTTKLSELNLGFQLINLYILVTEMLVRPRLTTIYTEPTPLYVTAYTAKHGPEISISLQDIIDTYKTLVTPEYLSAKIEYAAKKNKTVKAVEKETEVEEKSTENALSISNFFDEQVAPIEE